MSTPTPWTWRERHAFDLACGVCFDAGRGADDPLHDLARLRAERLWDLAARAGAEAMRERAAGVAEEHWGVCPRCGASDEADPGRAVADEIRSLEVP